MIGPETIYVDHYEIRSSDCIHHWPCRSFDNAEKKLEELKAEFPREEFEVIAVLTGF